MVVPDEREQRGEGRELRVPAPWQRPGQPARRSETRPPWRSPDDSDDEDRGTHVIVIDIG